jgi:hypothetical protein
MLSREATTDGARREYQAPKKEELGTPARTGFRGQYYPQQPTSVPVSEAPRSHPVAFDPSRRPGDGHQSQETPPQGYGRPPLEQETRREAAAPTGADPRVPFDTFSRRPGGEEMQASRSFLGLNSNPNKTGRASPLPQAVKGAQTQYVGPNSDPSVKSEFGRIFQGLGSGLGGPGSMTPSRQSPVPQRMREMTPSGLGDNDGTKMARVGSKGSRLGRRMNDEDGRQTPVGSGGRGGKRPNQGYVYVCVDSIKQACSVH